LGNDAVVELYSIEGNLVYSYALSKRTEKLIIDISNLNSGIYLLRIQNSDYNSTAKFLKN